MSKPAPSAGANTTTPPTPESPALLCCAVLFVPFPVARYEAVIANSATTRVCIAAASAAKSAEEKLMRTATFPTGTSDARWATITHNGKPGGCATPNP